jgi:tetratricopeptide (TPR) repeat protein
MSWSIRPGLVLGVLLAASAAPAQSPALRAPTRTELDQREAQRLYARALLQERDSRLIEAIESLEKALRLDPDSAHLHRAIVPLYLAVDRADDALQACSKALDLEAGDYETWYLYARQLKVQNETQKAIAALRRAVACPGLKDRPDMRLQVQFDLGVLHEGAQQFDEAEAAFAEVADLLDKGEAAVPADPAAGHEERAAQAAETYERLGRVCVRAKHFDRAVAAYRKAQEKDPQRRQRVCYNLADVYAGQGKLAEALKCLEDYLLTQPQGTEAYELEIDLLRRLRREPEVLPALEGHARADAQNEALKLLVARQYAAAGHTDQARARYDAILEHSANPDAYRGLFAVYRQEGPSGAARALERLDGALARAKPQKEGQDGDPNAAAQARAMLLALRDDPELVKAILPVVRDRLRQRRPPERETSRFLALLADRAHALEDAEGLYRACLSSAGAGPRSVESDVYAGLLHVLWQEHKYEAVVEACRQGLAQAQMTNLLVFHYDLSRALARLNRTEEALAEANRAVDIADEDNRLQMRCYRASLFALADRLPEAEAEGRALVKEFTKPGEVLEVRYTLSAIYSEARKNPEAEEQLQQILKDHPDEARAHNDLGYLWADQGKNLEEAEKLIRAALDLDRKQKKTGAHVEADSDEDNAAYLDSLGWVLFKRGRVAAARTEMEKACRLPEGADDPVVWDHAGDVYYKGGETERAKSAWQKAVELYGTGGRRRADDRLKDIEHKLKLLAPAAPGR